MGTGGAGYYLYAGQFDNVYYDSGNPANGSLYVVGNTGTAGGATLYQVAIAYSSLTGNENAIATGLNSTVHPWPSPVTEFCNNGANPCSLSQRTAIGRLSTTSPNVTLTSGTFTGADLGAADLGVTIKHTVRESHHQRTELYHREPDPVLQRQTKRARRSRSRAQNHLRNRLSILQRQPGRLKRLYQQYWKRLHFVL